MAASSSSVPCASMSGISSRATNGTVIKMVAMTIAGTAYKILMSLSINQLPIQPWVPKISTSIIPAMTGETENGKSMMVVRIDLPGKLNLATDQAAATPNTTLSGTAMAAVSKVSLTADKVSGCTSAWVYTPTPCLKASTNTRINGRIRQLRKKIRAMVSKV